MNSAPGCNSVTPCNESSELDVAIDFNLTSSESFIWESIFIAGKYVLICDKQLYCYAKPGQDTSSNSIKPTCFGGVLEDKLIIFCFSVHIFESCTLFKVFNICVSTVFTPTEILFHKSCWMCPFEVILPRYNFSVQAFQRLI